MMMDLFIKGSFCGAEAGAPFAAPRTKLAGSSGFTVVELLVTIAIIAVLASLSITATKAVKTGVGKAHAAADVHGIVIAVKAYETDYRRLPPLDLKRRALAGQDVAVGDRRMGMKIPNGELFYILRAMELGSNEEAAANFRRVVYFQGPNVKNPDRPVSGFLNTRSGNANEMDCFFDPWGRQYCVALDYSGDERIKLIYSDFVGENAPSVRVAAFSMGPDASIGASGNLIYQSRSTKSDDIISW